MVTEAWLRDFKVRFLMSVMLGAVYDILGLSDITVNNLFMEDAECLIRMYQLPGVYK